MLLGIETHLSGTAFIITWRPPCLCNLTSRLKFIFCEDVQHPYGDQRTVLGVSPSVHSLCDTVFHWLRPVGPCISRDAHVSAYRLTIVGTADVRPCTQILTWLLGICTHIFMFTEQALY